jgi:hypothetical protein
MVIEKEVGMVLKGVIRGKIIELEQEPGLPDGQAVAVTVEPVGTATSPTSPEAMEGLRRSAGGWSDDPEGLDQYLEYLRQQRKVGRREYLENDPKVVSKVMLHFGSLHVSVITVGELFTWASRAHAPVGRSRSFESIFRGSIRLASRGALWSDSRGFARSREARPADGPADRRHLIGV